MKKIVIVLLFLFPFAVFAQPLLVGKDYQVLKNSPVQEQADGKIHVIEFFSISCHWCYQLEPSLEKWLKVKPKDVTFTRVPVMFRQSWAPLVRVYYVAKTLGVEATMLPILFKALHVDHVDFQDKKALATLFEKAGIKKTVFDNVYSGSPIIDMEMSQSAILAKKYQIIYIPTFIVGGRYKVDSGMSKGDDKKMMNTLNFLINKARTDHMMSMARR